MPDVLTNSLLNYDKMRRDSLAPTSENFTCCIFKLIVVNLMKDDTQQLKIY